MLKWVTSLGGRRAAAAARERGWGLTGVWSRPGPGSSCQLRCMLHVLPASCLVWLGPGRQDSSTVQGHHHRNRLESQASRSCPSVSASAQQASRWRRASTNPPKDTEHDVSNATCGIAGRGRFCCALWLARRRGRLYCISKRLFREREIADTLIQNGSSDPAPVPARGSAPSNTELGRVIR